MTHITIPLNNKEEETFLVNLLNKLRVPFNKEEDFEFTDEMKKAVDEALKEDKSKFEDAFEVLDKISKKYGI